MLQDNLEKYVREQAMKFVISLDKQYAEWVSDQFIVVFLTRKFMDEVYRNNHVLRQNAAYKGAQELFEILLEYGCKAGGNGHHVAQLFASMFDLEEAYKNIPEI